MVDILHRVGVKNATPEKVYDALTTVDGLAGWWTDDTDGRARDVGGVLEFRFPPGGFDMEVVEPAGARARAWQVVDGPAGVDRHDDRLATSARTATTRSCCSAHQGWKEPVEFMHHCSTKWATRS